MVKTSIKFRQALYTRFTTHLHHPPYLASLISHLSLPLPSRINTSRLKIFFIVAINKISSCDVPRIFRYPIFPLSLVFSLYLVRRARTDDFSRSLNSSDHISSLSFVLWSNFLIIFAPPGSREVYKALCPCRPPPLTICSGIRDEFWSRLRMFESGYLYDSATLMSCLVFN